LTQPQHSQQASGMFDGKPTSRADLKSGTLYAVSGELDWIYYGQVTVDKRIGFFRRRDRDIASFSDILSAPLMAVVGVAYPSITRALRSGAWSKLGRSELAIGLEKPWPMVQWPVGTLIVGVSDGEREYHTRVEGPLSRAWKSLQAGMPSSTFRLGLPPTLEKKVRLGMLAGRYGGNVE
jgi:hypothetical protein